MRLRSFIIAVTVIAVVTVTGCSSSSKSSSGTDDHASDGLHGSLRSQGLGGGAHEPAGFQRR